MIIFDSLKHKNWNGRGLTKSGDNLVIVKSANLKHKVNLTMGTYTLKIIAKKRSGNGVINFSIQNTDKVCYLNKNITLSNSTWTEYVFHFECTQDVLSELIISRSSNVYGSIEIGRLLVQKQVINNTSIEKKIIVPIYTHEVKEGIYSSYLMKNSKQKIGIIIPYSIYGGGEIYLQEILNHVDEHQVNITMIYSKPNPIKFKLPDAIQHRDAKVPEHLVGVLKSERFDYIVFYNSLSIYNILSQLKESGEINSKIIEIYHSDFLWPDAVAKIRTRKGVDEFISVSSSLGKDIIGIKDANKHVIPVSIDIERFIPRNKIQIRQQLGITTSGRIFGTVARLSPEKNLTYILELAKILRDDLFLIIGDGPQKSFLELNKPNNVILMGFQNKIEYYYNALDAFILPSIIEGTPISILEAMSSGIPVYASKVGAIPDILQHSYSGWFLSMNLKKDCQLIEQSWIDADIVEHAREYIRENHLIKDNVDMFYNLLLNRNNFYSMSSDSIGRLKFSGEFI